MAQKKSPPITAWVVAVLGLLVVARAGDELLSWLTEAEDDGNPASPVVVDENKSRAVLGSAQASTRIVNVHEHLQSLADAPRLLEVMDAYGVAKSILMGSSWFTITLNERVGFTRYDENNAELVKIAKAYPGRFEAWPTINPNDPLKLEKLKQLVADGATGLKLYLGHGFIKRTDGRYMFHTMAMDDPEMLPVYAYCQRNFVPICFHVNPGPTRPGFAEEFIAVLEAFPDLKIICPHFMLSSIRDSRLREFLDTIPNLYSDLSFGHDSFLIQGLKRISKNPPKFRKIFSRYPTRFMWGTDLVITEHESKSVEWMSERFQAYLDMLTLTSYQVPFLPGEELNGLALEKDLLEGILFRNYEKFVALRPSGTKITRSMNWGKMGVEFTGRSAGQALPPPEK